ncbi:hypothetical protein RJ639_023793 [Escallonia herrerae]|uniref:Nodulation signaling pathway 2-like protein n=1 Tax=Escallonia herrerae TaxID=1293975 RepID=A0AA88V1V6_9ASTE|nr:hypothetical protein RJ639_023793 [Escallonia herrerae]
MNQPETLHPSWSHPDIMNISINAAGNFDFGTDLSDIGHYDLSSLFHTTEDCSNISLPTPNFTNIFSDEYMDYRIDADELDATLPMDDFSLVMEELDSILGDEVLDTSMEMVNVDDFPLEQSPREEDWSLSHSMSTTDPLMDMKPIQPSPTLPAEDMEIDNQLSIVHLVMAYGDAIENRQIDLAEVIVKRISEKVSPVGEIMERLLYYLFQPSDKQLDYLKEESLKNFHAAFKAFYQIFPYGKFAHFAANFAILEAMPRDADVIHIIDFDVGDGVQWSEMIEAIGHQQREVRLTCVKCAEEDSHWKFEETKMRLYDHARSFGLKLKVEEIALHDLNELKEMVNMNGRNEWFAFNCMVGLPHMGRVRSGKDVLEFLRVAKEILVPYTGKHGVVTFGDGEAWEMYKNSSNYGSFLEGYLVHYQALLESMQCNFPVHLGDARTAIECLFVSPFVSSLAWNRKWEERKECGDIQLSWFGLEGWTVSKESLMEAKEMAREGQTLYGVRVDGKDKNELVLEWRGAPLVKISCWRS